MKKPSKNFWQRAVFGTLFLAMTVLVIALSHSRVGRWLFFTGVLGLNGIALYEYCRLCRRGTYAVACPVMLGASSLYLFVRFKALLSPALDHLPALVLLLGALCCAFFFFRRPSNALSDLALTIFSFPLVTFPLSLLLDLNFVPKLVSGTQSSFWLIWLLSVTKGSDIVAYFTGKCFGQRPLAPHISPKKTVEGALSGLVAGAVISIILSFVYRKMIPIPMNLDAWGMLGLVIAGVAIFGDLTESLLKRSVDLKDSSDLPGLGGILDMMDSLVFAVPALYFFLSVSEALL